MTPRVRPFKDALRASAFAALEPSGTSTILPHIFNTSASSQVKASATKAAGGILKRAVPQHLAGSSHVHIDRLDTEFGITRMTDASLDVKRAQALVDTFGTCWSSAAADTVSANEVSPASPSSPATTTTTTTTVGSITGNNNLYTMDEQEFAGLLQKARARREEYQARVTEYPIRTRDPAYLHQFLQLDSTHDTQYSCSIAQPAHLAGVAKRGAAVRGRVLHRVKDGYAVAVAGTVAFLPSTSPSSSSSSRHANSAPHYRSTVNVLVDRQTVSTFYVRDVLWERAGRDGKARSMVVLSMQPVETSDDDTADANSGSEQVGASSSGLGDKASASLDIQSLLDDLLQANAPQSNTSPAGNGDTANADAKSASSSKDALFDFMDLAAPAPPSSKPQ